MEKLSQRKQTKECCEQAVRLVYEQKSPVIEAARGLSLSDQTADLEAEVARLKRELTAARRECDILKRTVAYFAKPKLPVGGSS